MLVLLCTLSLSLSLYLYSSSPYDRRHRPPCGNISYEGSGMILGWFIRLRGWFRFLARTDGRTKVFQKKNLGRSNPILLRGNWAWIDLQGLQLLNYQIGFIFHKPVSFQNPGKFIKSLCPEAVGTYRLQKEKLQIHFKNTLLENTILIRINP